MATDATGTPTSPDSIPTYNTAVDSPSGLGFNAAMAQIQTALSARVNAPANIATGEAPIWNGSAWVRSSVTGLSPSGIAGYPFPGTIMGYGTNQAISTAGATFAAGQNLLAANISFTADGASKYIVVAFPPYAQHNFAGLTTILLQAALDGVANSFISQAQSPAANQQMNISGGGDLGVPSAGVHTVNAKAFSGAGATLAMPAGGPVYVMKVT